MSEATTPSFAYLGPAGTYHDEAARAFAHRLGIENPELVECPSLSEVFDCVDRGRTEYGVVATENALEGPVTATLDNFAFRSSATILGEHVLDIHHCLIMHPDATRDDVKTVVSHPQGLGQCRRYLNDKLHGIPTMTVASTADSARRAAADKSVAGIGNAFAAELYGARVEEACIEDHFGNQTSFALIGRQGHVPVLTGTKFKTSLALFLQADRPGALLIDPVRVRLRGHQPGEDPKPPHEAGAGRLHVLRGHRRLHVRPGSADGPELPAPKAARGEGPGKLPRGVREGFPVTSQNVGPSESSGLIR